MKHKISKLIELEQNILLSNKWIKLKKSFFQNFLICVFTKKILIILKMLFCFALRRFRLNFTSDSASLEPD